MLKITPAGDPKNLPGSGTAEGTETMASMAYQRLRHDIINAQYASGQKLRIRELCTRYEVGLSPMREALNRLSSDGLISQNDRRGFSVTPLTAEHLHELIKTRCWLNEIALRESIANGDSAWEEAIVLAQHRMSRIPRYLNEGTERVYNPEWEKVHRDFHSSLISACGSRWLKVFCEQLFDAADCFRHLSRVSSVRRELRQDEHRAIMDAAIARDADKAVELLRLHLTSTAALVEERLPDLLGNQIRRPE
jgi:GntR family transcriptional regulator, carbon starvation induced regulator